jgi:hypothetical protein
MNAPRFIRTAAISLLLAPAAGFAAGAAGNSSAVFLTLPPDAASASMGGIQAPGASASAALGDPAGLAWAGGTAGFSHSFWFDGLSYNTMYAALPWGPGTLGLGVRYMRYGGIEALDNTGAAAGSISPMDISAGAAYGVDLGGGWSAGAGVKYIRSRVASSVSGAAGDAGLDYRSGAFSAGASVQNAGGKLKFYKEAYPLPLLYRGRAAYKFGALTALVEGNLQRSGPGWLACGAEYPLSVKASTLVLRAGYSGRYTDTGGLNGWSAGFGLGIRDTVISYAFVPAGELGSAHLFSVELRWGDGAGAGERGGGMVMYIP